MEMDSDETKMENKKTETKKGKIFKMEIDSEEIEESEKLRTKMKYIKLESENMEIEIANVKAETGNINNEVAKTNDNLLLETKKNIDTEKLKDENDTITEIKSKDMSIKENSEQKNIENDIISDEKLDDCVMDDDEGVFKVPKMINIPKRRKKKIKRASEDTKVLEKIKLKQTLSTRFACKYSTDRKVLIVGSGGIYILELMARMNCANNIFSFKKRFYKVSDYKLSLHVGIDISSFIQYLPRFDLYEAVLRLDLTAGNLSKCKAEKISPVIAKWSPEGLMKYRECVLTVLSNMGSLEIVMHYYNNFQIDSYKCIANISEQFINQVKDEWKDFSECKPIEQYNELKLRSEKCTPTEFTWSNLFVKNDVKCSILFVGYLDGGVSAWRFEAEIDYVTNKTLDFIGYQKTTLKRITAMYWVKSEFKDKGFVIIGDIEGRTLILPVEGITESNLLFGDEFMLWEQIDNIQIDYIDFYIHEKNGFIFVVKNNILLVFVVDDKIKVLQQGICHLGNIHITGFQHYEDNLFVVSTFMGMVYYVAIVYVDNKLEINLDLMEININWRSKKCYGLVASPNKVFYLLVTHPWRNSEIVRNKTLIKVYVLKNLLKDSLEVLLEDDKTSLEPYWDCFEMLRCRAAIEKENPCTGISNDINYDTESLMRLKIYMFVAKISEVLHDNVLFVNEYHIKSYDYIRQVIEIRMAINRMKKLLKLYHLNKISRYQLQSLCILNLFLKEMVISKQIIDLELGNNTVDSIYEVMAEANKIQFPLLPRCVWCGEIPYREKCVPEHYEMRCSISKMPIVPLPGYYCLFCGAMVDKEIEKEYKFMTCPFCDIPMFKREMSYLVKPPDAKEEERLFLGEKYFSPCYSDCDKEVIDFNDIEDEALIKYIDDETFIQSVIKISPGRFKGETKDDERDSIILPEYVRSVKKTPAKVKADIKAQKEKVKRRLKLVNELIKRIEMM